MQLNAVSKSCTVCKAHATEHAKTDHPFVEHVRRSFNYERFKDTQVKADEKMKNLEAETEKHNQEALAFDTVSFGALSRITS